MKATTTCTTCGGELQGSASPLGALCPACVLRASCTPDSEVGGTLTTWAEVFPQLEVVATLRDAEGLSAYLARVVGDGHFDRAVLQVASGMELKEAGGAAALTARCRRLAGCEIDGLAAVLDFGDLADAFFLVTEAPELPTLPAALEGKVAEELSLLVSAAAREGEAITRAGRAMGLSLRFDPDLCFVEEETGRVVQTPGLLPGALEPLPETPEMAALTAGHQLGAFRLEEQVGEGGFGKVWRARQERPVVRTVALKVLKSGLHSQRARARFDVEQQALAKLDHPHIARFFDGGTTPDGRPYFAMEWIDGKSLGQFLKTGDPSLELRLRVFREVCEAVQHAHQKGIIHRDLKSSNVMVTGGLGQASAKVIDFGIARALEDPLVDQTQLTRAEEILGTPAAMSPEQAAGGGGSDLDARTDVYGLGVLLYELLCGQLPFDPALPADELRRQIREDDPIKPSVRLGIAAQARRVRGDLDWITMRCLEKDPARRYGSVEGLLGDLQRHLQNEPVAAGPPGIRYRIGKLIRRHRAAVGTVLVVMASLIAGLFLALAGYREARAQANDARKARDSSHREAVTTRKTLDFLQSEFFDQIDPTKNPNPNIALREVVLRATSRIGTSIGSNPAVEAELRETLGTALTGLAEFDLAAEQFQRVLEIQGPDTMTGAEVSRALADVLRRSGRNDEALGVQEKACGVIAHLQGFHSPEHLAALQELANIHRLAGHFEEAITGLQEVLDSRLRLQRMSDPESVRAVFYLGHASNGTVSVEKYREQIDAETALQDADQETVDALIRLGMVDVDRLVQIFEPKLRARLTEAGPLDPRARELAIILTSAAWASRDSLHKPLILRILDSTGATDEGRGQEHGLPMGKETLWESMFSNLGPKHPYVLRSTAHLMDALYYTGDRERALAIGQRVYDGIRGSEAQLDYEPRSHFLGVFSGLTAQFSKLLESCKRIAESSETLVSAINGAVASMATGNRDAYSEFVELALDRHGDSQDPIVHERLARILLFADWFAPAQREQFVRLGRDHARKALAGERPDPFATPRAVVAHVAGGEYEEAIRLMDEFAPNGPSGQLWDSELLLMRALALHRSGETNRAVPFVRQARELLRRSLYSWRFRWFVDYTQYDTLLLDHVCREIPEAGLSDLSHFQQWWPLSDELYGEVVRMETARRADLEGLLRRNSPAVRAVLVSTTSEWSWLHPVNGIDPATLDPDFHQTFHLPDYDDSAWRTGRDAEGSTGGFGYGDEEFNGVDLGTPPGDPNENGKRNGKSAYFRHRFTTTEEYRNLELRCQRDDGIIVYLDGIAVGRSNMSTGEEAYHLPALFPVAGPFETATYRTPLKLPGGTLPAGEHILAISLHNHAKPSTDLRIGGITLVEVESTARHE